MDTKTFFSRTRRRTTRHYIKKKIVNKVQSGPVQTETDTKTFHKLKLVWFYFFSTFTYHHCFNSNFRRQFRCAGSAVYCPRGAPANANLHLHSTFSCAVLAIRNLFWVVHINKLLSVDSNDDNFWSSVWFWPPMACIWWFYRKNKNFYTGLNFRKKA
jgi:hypothetical protein